MPFNSALASKAINATLFNIGWAACVLLRNEFSLLVAAAILFIHLRFINKNSREWVFLAVVCVIGLSIDYFMRASGLLKPVSSAVPAVLWMGALWPMLASTLNCSLSALRDRPLFSAVVGAISGPFAYFTAVKLGAASRGVDLFIFIACLAVLWAMLLPLLYMLAKKIGVEE